MVIAALLGNPNVGKTTLFNSLTGSNQYVGNWAGVTVEEKEGFVNRDIKLVDLPGIYAMDTYSNEEKVSKDFLLNGNVDVIVNIVDASNLDRNLYLTVQLKKFKKPIILILNMIDAAEKKGIHIDCETLSKELGVTVVPIIASKEKGIDKVKALLSGSDFLREPVDNDSQLSGEKEVYGYIEDILKKCVSYSSSSGVSATERIDSIVLNKYLAYPVFFIILFLIFNFTFKWVGQPLANLLQQLINSFFVPMVGKLLFQSSPWFKSLIIDGVIGGVGSVIVFLPVILSLFLGISFLEDSGYMARAAFIMDKLMRKMGLSGKAFIPMVVGFGCSVPGIMSARTLESEKDRKLTALLVPLMSCNARLPVYALFASAFFPRNGTFVVFSLYILGILMAFMLGILFRETIFKKDEEPLIIELPEYKLPELKSIWLHTWEKGRGFLKKVGTIIFSMSILIWFLSNFNFGGMTGINGSFLSDIGRFISPIFKPLGFASWQNSVALLAGLMSKEVIIGTLGVIYKGSVTSGLHTGFTALSAYSFLVFVLLYTPCVSVIAAMKKEYGKKMAVFSVSYQLVLAWTVSFVVYNAGALISRI